METELHSPSKERLGLGGWIILSGVIGLLVAIAIPNFVKARTIECENSCVNHLRELADAKKKYVMKQGVPASGFRMENLIGPGKLIEQTPACPAGGTYDLGAVNESPTCSIGGDHQLPQ